MKTYIGTWWGLLRILYVWILEINMFDAHRDGAAWNDLILIALTPLLIVVMAVIGIAKDDRNKWDKNKDL